MHGPLGNWLIIAGLILVIVGGLAKFGWLSWFGGLPGDIHLKREGFQLFLPVSSMILVSLALSGLAHLIRRFW